VRVLGGEVFLQQAYHFCQAARQGRVVLRAAPPRDCASW
jgi:hypothetical protein